MNIHEEIIDKSQKLFNEYFSKKEYKVNVFLTGSIARNDEIYKKASLISDIDYIFVFKNVIKRNVRKQIKKQLVSIWNKDKFLSRFKYSFIFITEKQLTKNRLSELYLSSDLNNPLFSNYYFDDDLLKKRICFANQPIGYYYSKYIVFNDDRFLIKSIFFQLKVLLYINHYCTPSHYIHNIELINNNDFIEKIVPDINLDKLYEQYSQCFIHYNCTDLQVVFDKTRNVLLKYKSKENQLCSVRFFNLFYNLVKHNSTCSKYIAKLIIYLVNKENLS